VDCVDRAPLFQVQAVNHMLPPVSALFYTINQPEKSQIRPNLFKVKAMQA
jgi:hypothetical protein